MQSLHLESLDMATFFRSQYTHSPHCWPTQSLLMAPNVRHNPRRSLGSSWQRRWSWATTCWKYLKITTSCMLNCERLMINVYIFSKNKSKCAVLPEIQVLTQIQIPTFLYKFDKLLANNYYLTLRIEVSFWSSEVRAVQSTARVYLIQLSSKALSTWCEFLLRPGAWSPNQHSYPQQSLSEDGLLRCRFSCKPSCGNQLIWNALYRIPPKIGDLDPRLGRDSTVHTNKA